MAKVDGRLRKLIVQRDGQTHSERKGENHARGGNGQRVLGIAFKHPDVNLQTNEEQKHHKSDRRREGEDGNRLGGEDSVGEVGDATHDGRTKQDAPNDLGDDTGLAHLGEEDSEELSGGNDYEDLDNPQRERVASVPCGGIGTRNDCA